LPTIATLDPGARHRAFTGLWRGWRNGLVSAFSVTVQLPTGTRVMVVLRPAFNDTVPDFPAHW